MFEKYQRRPAPGRRSEQGRPFRNPSFQGSSRQGQFYQGPPRPQPGTAEAVSPAVKTSVLARAGQAGKARDAALCFSGGGPPQVTALLLEWPALALRHGELLAELGFQDRSY